MVTNTVHAVDVSHPQRELEALSNNVEIIQAAAQNIFNDAEKIIENLYNLGLTKTIPCQTPLVFTYFLDTLPHTTHKCYHLYFKKVGEICWPKTSTLAIYHFSQAYEELVQLGAVEILSKSNHHFLEQVATLLCPLFSERIHDASQWKFRIEVQPYTVRNLEAYQCFNISGKNPIQTLKVIIFQGNADPLTPPPFSVTSQPVQECDATHAYFKPYGHIRYETALEGHDPNDRTSLSWLNV